jgi:predicted phage terminase large subunit-like protein
MTAKVPTDKRAALLEQLLAYRTPKEQAEASLHEFVKQAWPCVESSVAFVDNWHIEAVCRHLEATLDGSIRQLLLTIPPGCMKSLLTSVFLPCWAWGPRRRPDVRWLFLSYDQRLSTRDSLKCRYLIESPWYQQNWGKVFSLAKDQNQKTRFDTDARGWRIASCVGGLGTGEHPDMLIADDFMNAAQAHSETERKSRIEWWEQTIPTRGVSRGVRRIVIGQRLHEDDLPGHLLAEGGWEHICLPMEFETGRMQPTSLGWTDPRTKVGELLWPALFNKASVDETARKLRPHGAAGQLQQRPTAPQGELFKREWFKQQIDESELPADFYAIGTAVRYWDKAGTESSGDYTAGVLVVKYGPKWYVRDVVRGQWGAWRREQTIKQTAEADAVKFSRVSVWQEREPGSGGKESAENTVRNLAGYAIRSDLVTGEKTSRWEGWEAQLEAGNIVIVRGMWNHDFIDEHCAAPNGKHDDQIDAAAGAFIKLALRRGFCVA